MCSRATCGPERTMRRCLVAFFLVPGLLWTVIARGAETSSPDQQLLKAAGLPTDGGGLLAFFHMRTHPEEERALIPSLIEQLGAGTSDARNLAAGRLVALGPAAVPLLRQAAKDPDEPAIMTGAQRCLAAIQNAALPAAAARLLRPLRPAGAAQTLL